MKLLRNNGQVFEIDANEVNEIKVDVIPVWNSGSKVQITFISDEIDFRKVFELKNTLNGDCEAFFLEIINRTLQNSLSYFQDDEILNETKFPLEAIFEEVVKLTKRVSTYQPNSLLRLFLLKNERNS